MVDLTLSYGMVIFLLLGLVVIKSLRTKLMDEDISGYRYMTVGISLMAILSLFRIFFFQGLLSEIPFISEEIFFNILSVIGTMVGLIFLTSGLSSWLPISQSYRKYNREEIQRLELIKQVAQMIKNKTNTKEIVRETLDLFIDNYNFSYGSVFLVSHKNSTVKLISSVTDNNETKYALENIKFNKHFLQHPTAINEIRIKELPEDLTTPNIFEPIIVSDKVVGMFLLWGDTTDECYDRYRSNIKIISDIIGRKIELDKMNIGLDFESGMKHWKNEIKEIINNKKSIKEILPSINNKLKEKIPVDLITISILSNKLSGDRYVIGESNTLLHESHINLSDIITQYDQTVENEMPTVVNFNSDVIGLKEKLYLPAEMNSMIVSPIVNEGRKIGYLTLSASKSGCYNKSHCYQLVEIMPYLNLMAINNKIKTIEETTQQTYSSINKFLKTMNKTKTVSDKYNAVGNYLFETLNPSVVRILSFDTDNAFLTSQYMRATDKLSVNTPPAGFMILSLMPLHARCHETLEAVRFNLDKKYDHVSEIELNQAFSVDSVNGIIIPVKIDKQVVSAISIGFTDAHRFVTNNEQQLIETISSLLADDLKSSLGDMNKKSSDILENNLETIITSGDDRGRARSALSGIMGSIELLKTREKTDESLSKYINIIDTSARKLSKYIDAEEVSYQ